VKAARPIPILQLPPTPPLAKGARVWLAYSGGLDSTALLHLLHAAKTPRLQVLHVHHGLQADAEAWARRCQAQCRRLRLPFVELRVQIDPADAAGPEAAARAARYAALRAQMKAGDLLITAHHRDDQAETVLQRLLRGAGVSGLAAMRPLTPFAPGALWRPLLQTPRERIHAYALQLKLRWIEDPHNHAPRYARSFLRQDILPRLHRHWPQAEASLARAAEHCAEAVELLEELARQDLATVQLGEALGVKALRALGDARRRNLLRYWLQLRGYEALSADALQRLDREVLQARVDAQPLLHCGACEFRRYRDALYLMAALPPVPAPAEISWKGAGRLILPPGCGVLCSSARKALPFTLGVRFMAGGEKIRPAGDIHSRTLKYLFQLHEVPPWRRLRTPLIYRDDALVSVGDRWLSAEWAGELQRRRIRIEWRDA
jgi:tRNA(Ile)-lysidine synthase